MTLKLGDYSLGIYKYPDDYYQNIPIRWCDPESLFFDANMLQIKKLTEKNNIWSLGVTLWEICERSPPYVNLTNEDVLQLLQLRNILNRPTRNAEWTDNM